MATQPANESSRPVNDVVIADPVAAPESARSAVEDTNENAVRTRWDMNEVFGLKRRLQ